MKANSAAVANDIYLINYYYFIIKTYNKVKCNNYSEFLLVILFQIRVGILKRFTHKLLLIVV